MWLSYSNLDYKAEHDIFKLSSKEISPSFFISLYLSVKRRVEKFVSGAIGWLVGLWKGEAGMGRKRPEDNFAPYKTEE